MGSGLAAGGWMGRCSGQAVQRQAARACGTREEAAGLEWYSGMRLPPSLAPPHQLRLLAHPPPTFLPPSPPPALLPCSVEDIQGLFALAPKGCKPKPALMATYYAKLTQIFTKSESRLYSAYAWYR